MNTSLNEIRAHYPCADGWRKLLRALGKDGADDEPLSIITVLDSNGLDDALWCLRAVPGHDREKRLFAVWCARQVQHLMTDARSITALEVAERYANGLASKEELAAAWAAAGDSGGAATGDAVWSAAQASAWASAVGAGWASTGAAAWSAAWASAWASAGESGGESGGAATGDAAWSAAWDAAGDAAKDKQSAELRRVCLCIDSGTDPYPIKESA